MFKPVNDQGVGFSNDFSDFPSRRSRTGNGGDALRVYAETGGGPGRARATPSRVDLQSRTVPDRWRPMHRRRSTWTAPVVATHTGPSTGRCARSSQRLQPLRCRACRCTGSARARSPAPARSPRAPSTPGRAPPSGRRSPGRPRFPAARPDRLRHPLRRHPFARRRLVRVAARGRRRSHRQPGRALHPVPRKDGSTTASSPTLNAWPITFAPAPTRARAGHGHGRPAAPRPTRRSPPRPPASPTPTATRSPTATAGSATGRASPAPRPRRSTCVAGNGDRGDQVRVEVFATDGRGAASDPAAGEVTVAARPRPPAPSRSSRARRPPTTP